MVYSLPMKAYPVVLRKRIVRFVEKGGSKAEAAKRFEVGRQTVYRYLKAAQKGGLDPKPQPGRRRTFADEALRKDVEARPSATLKERAAAFGVRHNAVWKRLRLLKMTLKKNS